MLGMYAYVSFLGIKPLGQNNAVAFTTNCFVVNSKGNHQCHFSPGCLYSCSELSASACVSTFQFLFCIFHRRDSNYPQCACATRVTVLVLCVCVCVCVCVSHQANLRSGASTRLTKGTSGLSGTFFTIRKRRFL